VPPKRPTVARRHFDTALQRLRSVGVIVSDLSVERSSYQVDEGQIKELEALPLGKLGQVSLASLSSGAAALINQFTSIKLACEELLKTGQRRRLLLLIDEGDAFLHLGWQQQYVEYLDKTVNDLKKKFLSVQVVVASHSPILISDFPRECIFHLGRHDWMEELLEGGSLHRPKASFAAPLDAVVRDVAQAGSLGAFATRIIRSLVQDVSKGFEVSPNRVAMIDDPVIRQQILKLIDARHRRTNEV
jgi:predicted ATP-binding protein involved in virulence